MSERLRRTALGLSGLVAALVVWQLFVSLVPEGELLSRFGPADAFPALIDFVTTRIGVDATADTLRRLTLGLAAAVALGATVGVAVGLSRTAGEASSWIFQFLRMISPLAWTPVAVAAFGIGDPPVFFLVLVASIWPVILSTAAGVEAVDAGWVSVARSLDANRVDVIRHVYLPAVRGHIGTGVRLALGTAWIVIVPAEMLGVDSGLGYAILDARDRLDYPELMGIIVWIGVLGTLLDLVVRRITRPRLEAAPKHRRLGRRSSGPTHHRVADASAWVPQR